MKLAVLLFATTLSLASTALAQAFPAPPKSSSEAGLATDQITIAFANDSIAQNGVNKVADKKFWMWNTPALAANAADLAQTAQCLLAQTCVEQNPLLGSNPSMARLFGTSLPVFAGELGFSYYMKKSGHNWKAIPALSAVTHVVAVGTSLAAR